MDAGAGLDARVLGPMSVLGTAALAPAAVRRCRRAFPRPLVPFILNHFDVVVSKDTGWALAAGLVAKGLRLRHALLRARRRCSCQGRCLRKRTLSNGRRSDSYRYRVGHDDLGVGVAIAIVSAGIAALGCSTRAEALAEQCGAGTPALRQASERLPLTDREREIVMLLGEGLSSPAIAERLTLSVRTVEGHIYRAMAKTGTSSRDELAALLPRHKRASRE